MNMTADQFVRRNGQDTFKLVVSNDVVSSSKGWVLPNTLANFTLPFGTCGWGREGHHLEGRCGRRQGTKKR